MKSYELDELIITRENMDEVVRVFEENCTAITRMHDVETEINEMLAIGEDSLAELASVLLQADFFDFVTDEKAENYLIEALYDLGIRDCNFREYDRDEPRPSLAELQYFCDNMEYPFSFDLNKGNICDLASMVYEEDARDEWNSVYPDLVRAILGHKAA